MVIITLLTQVRKEKNGKINFHPGIKPGTQRLGVQYTRHQAITQDKSLSPPFPYVLPVVVGGSANLTLTDPPKSSLWVPGLMPRRKFIFPFFIPTTLVVYGNNYSVDTGEEGKERKDKLPSGHRTWHLASNLKFIFPFFSFLTCVNRVIITIPSPGGLRIPIILVVYVEDMHSQL